MPAQLNKIPFYFHQVEEYWFHGPQRRFARDAGIGENTFSRLLHGQTEHPEFSTICKVVTLLEKKLRIKLDPRDVYQGS